MEGFDEAVELQLILQSEELQETKSSLRGREMSTSSR